ncbi:TIGR03032 family protein [Pseudoalteromonas sp. GB56]
MSFEFTYSKNIPELMRRLNISVMFTTYQADRVVLLNSSDSGLKCLVRYFPRPMGIALNDDLLAIAMKDQVTTFKQSSKLAFEYPNKPGQYDSIFFPLSVHFTGKIDAHDVSFSNEGLVVVSTAYNCISKVGGTFGFEPLWKPDFIDEVFPTDKCHLNGMAIDENGELALATAFSETNVYFGWKQTNQNGLLFDLRNNTVVCRDLQMPHSPRVFNGDIYLLESLAETLVRIDRETGMKEVLYKFTGFARGMNLIGKYAFIGISKFREESLRNLSINIDNSNVVPSIVVFDLSKNTVIGEIQFHSDIEEIYDVVCVKGTISTNILNSNEVDGYNPINTPSLTGWFKTEGD